MRLVQPSLTWIAIGGLASGLHLLLLHLAVLRALGLEPERARKRVTRGLPLRLLILAPIMALAARTGLAACVGYVVGSMATRWVLCIWTGLRGEIRFALGK